MRIQVIELNIEVAVDADAFAEAPPIMMHGDQENPIDVYAQDLREVVRNAIRSIIDKHREDRRQYWPCDTAYIYDDGVKISEPKETGWEPF